jgi:hypothetical protein
LGSLRYLNKMTEPNYPWYRNATPEDPLMQGDIIRNCPLLLPRNSPAQNSTVEFIETDQVCYDIIIMSQSCDLVQMKLELVLVCPVWTLSEFENSNDFFKSIEGKEALRRGFSFGYHLLLAPPDDGFNDKFLVVDFRSVYSVGFGFLDGLKQKIGERPELLPPYREHLSQAFARFFMRVGLPLDIPKFK